jgi:hypothetical protein
VKSGLEWLNDIVVPGLRKGAGDCEWKIEVHGNEADIPSETEDDDENGLPESPGPAVYIITKGPRRRKEEEEESKREDDLLPTIPLSFFSY